jgi:3',5'-cyclic AMP phosphodiesterase CpdA
MIEVVTPVNPHYLLASSCATSSGRRPVLCWSGRVKGGASSSPPLGSRRIPGIVGRERGQLKDHHVNENRGPSRPTRRDVIIAHASDLHVDDGYSARLFGGDGAGPLRAVLEAASKNAADVVLLAGDTFDCHRLPGSLLEHTAATIREFGLPIVLLPGNHDPAVEDAVFHHQAFAGLDHLHVLGITHRNAVRFPELDLEIWGRPHHDYGDMDPLAVPLERSTAWQIAMAHGHYEPVPDRSLKLRASWLIGDDEIAATRADYIALGHWNRRVKVGTDDIHAWYSGSPDYARSINVVHLGANSGVQVVRAHLDLPEEFGI